MKKIFTLVLFSVFLFACSESKTKQDEIKTKKVSGPILTSSFKVWGNCETCKENIENALKVDGVSASDWNSETNIISVTYDSTKIKLEKIEKNIAAAGYDNIAYKGDDKAYAELAPCCQYDRKK